MNCRKIACSLLFFFCATGVYAQDTSDASRYYLAGIEKLKSDDYEEAAELFSKTIALQPDNYFAIHNRGLARSLQEDYESALADMDQTLKVAPAYERGYLNRGILKKTLTDYIGALADFNKAIDLKADYPDPYYHRGLVYQLLKKKDLACADFVKAKELGVERAEWKVKDCADKEKEDYNSILRLTKTAENKKYGFTPERPVKVGKGPDGGPDNQHTYLRLLRDAQGKSVQYERLGSCCAYESENGFLGMALLDRYELTYRDEKEKKRTTIVYISFYDYEEPMILQGFKTVGVK